MSYMDEKEKNTTKEVPDLEALSRSALENLEPSLDDNQIDKSDLEEFDAGMHDASLIFKTEVEKKEELEKEESKKSFIKNIGNQWKNLPKKKKIIVMVGIVLLLILIIVGIIFLIPKKATEGETSKLPDVILSGENYRYENGTLIFLDGDNEVGTYECENKDQERCKVSSLEEDHFDEPIKLDEDGNKIVFSSPIYENRYVFIIDHKNESDKDIILYDMKENKKVTTVYGIKNYKEGYVAFKDDESHWGLKKIESEAIKDIIPSEYDELGILPNQDKVSKVAVMKNSHSYIADVANKILSKAIPNRIVASDDKHIVTVGEDKKYHVYDYNAKELHDTPRDYIRIVQNYIIAVDDKTLYVYDDENHPMIMDGVKLKNDSYQVKETYKLKKLSKLERSFDASVVEKVLNITIYDEENEETRTINLLEGELSKTLAFLNYFDGTLYIYKNEEKKDVIGRYTCEHKNNIETSTKTLENCRIASESFLRETRGNSKERDLSSKTGWIPIFGEKYAFIKDGEANILYDLTKGSKIATYKTIDTSSYTEVNEITFISASEVPFIAQSNSSNKYGVAKITSEGVSSVIDFKYDSIKKLGDYYVVEENGKYALVTSKGQSIENFNEKSSPIVDYHKNYVKTTKDDMYFVHSFERPISDNAYNYIELYDEYYAAVLNGYVMIYDYQNKLITKERDERLKLNLTNYNGDGTKAFKMTFQKESVIVEIGQSNNTYGSKTIISLKGEEEEPKQPEEPKTDNQNNGGTTNDES